MSPTSRATGCGWLRAFFSSRRAATAVVTVLGLGLGMIPGVCPAQAEDGLAHGVLPTKNQHVFVPTTFIPDAFVNTTLGLTIGYSNTIKSDIPIFAPDGSQIGAVNADLLFMSGGVEFNCALRDWIGFMARFSALARTGSSTQSILASGLSAGSGFTLGWEFRLHENESSILSGSATVGTTSVTLIDVRSYVTDPSLGLSHSSTPLLASLAARYARGFNDLVGLSAFGEVGLGENPAENLDNTGFWRIGAALSLNLDQRHDLPLGFALGMRTSSYPITSENPAGNSWTWLLSMAYMGRSDFALTLDTEFEQVPIDYYDVTMSYLGVTIGLKYCF